MLFDNTAAAAAAVLSDGVVEVVDVLGRVQPWRNVDKATVHKQVRQL